LSPSNNPGQSAGCGIAGCLGGLLFGIIGSSLLLVLLAFLTAIFSTVQSIPSPSPATPDFKVTLTEDFLNRFIEQPADGTVEVNVLPANQVQLIANLPVEVLGAQLPVQLRGLFQIELIPPTVKVTLVDTQVSGANLNISGVFEGDVTTINENLQNALNDISALTGLSVTISGLQTNDSDIQIELTEEP
jgi:hypothetical protein